MSLIQAIRPNSGGRRNTTDSFFGVVKSYHIEDEAVPYVLVSVVGTDKERRVALNPDTKYNRPNPKYDRPTIADLTKGKMKTAIGGTVRIESAYEDRSTKTWLARWVGSALKTPEQGIVRSFDEARVGSLVTKQDGKTYRPLDILHSDRAIPVCSLKELDTAIADAITSSNGAFIRIREPDAAGKSSYEGVFVSGGRADADVQTRIERALGSDNANFKLLRTALAESDAPEGSLVEVVPTHRVFFGSESATQRTLDAIFCGKLDDNRTYSKGFTDLLATFHYHEGSEDLMCVSAIPKFNPALFSRVGMSFESDGEAGAESVESAASGASGAAESDADDQLPPEMDLEEAMSAPASDTPRSRSAEPAF